jgi:hypothetical protein
MTNLTRDELRAEFERDYPGYKLTEESQLDAYIFAREQLTSDEFKLLAETWIKTPLSEQERLALIARGQLVKELGVSEEGFKHLYWCITRREYPDAHLPLLHGLLRAYNEKKGMMIMAWRGFGKSTDLLVWCLLLIGVNPVGSTAFVRINGPKADESGNMVAEIIEKHESWKACFPNVIPDTDKGWSIQRGYFVIDTNVSGLAGSEGYEAGYSDWRQKCFSDHTAEPSLICAGVESGVIIGLHPTNGFWFDDLHDENNTRSKAEMQKVVDILEGNIIPTWFTPKGKPIIACACTPWDSDADAYHAMLKTGMFELVKIPIFTDAEEDGDGVWFAPLEKSVILAWPEAYPIERVVEIYNSNISRFFQMFLLDDKAARLSMKYSYQNFEHEHIKWTDWQIGGGADPIYSMEQTDKKGTHYFALAYLLITPLGTGILGGGVLEKCSASQGMAHIAKAQMTFNNWLNTWCEADAGNAVFIQLSIAFPGVRVIPFPLRAVAKGKKADRQYSFLEKPLRDGLLMVSDQDTPFLNTFRSYLLRFPNFADNAPEWDVADAVVAALYGRPQIWQRAGAELVGSPAYTLAQHRNMHDPTANLSSYSYLKKG